MEVLFERVRSATIHSREENDALTHESVRAASHKNSSTLAASLILDGVISPQGPAEDG
jgi:hypothetical protein